MEQVMLADMKEELEKIDMDNLKFDAIIQLKTWQREMHGLIDRTYQKRLQEIDTIVCERDEKIQQLENRLQTLKENDRQTMQNIKNSIDVLKSPINVVETIPESFQERIERTVQIRSILSNAKHELIDEDDLDDDEEDDDDEPVIVNFRKNEHRPNENVTVVEVTPATDSRVAKVFYSQPIQHALAVNLAKAIAHVGTIAATSTTTAAATTMAKTAVIATACGIGTVAYGVGRIAIGTTQKVWSLVFSSDN